jgi:hypothetical protein
MRKNPCKASDYKLGQERDINWNLTASKAAEYINANGHGASCIAGVSARSARDGKLFNTIHCRITRLCTSPDAYQRLVRERWSLESCYWIRGTHFQGYIPLPRKRRRRVGHSANRRHYCDVLGRIPFDPSWLASGDV